MGFGAPPLLRKDLPARKLLFGARNEDVGRRNGKAAKSASTLQRDKAIRDKKLQNVKKNILTLLWVF